MSLADGFGCDFLNTNIGQLVELHLVRDNLVQGRILDTQGRPVSGMSVQVLDLGAANRQQPLDFVLGKWKQRDYYDAIPQLPRHLQGELAVLLQTTTDKQGRFVLRGLGSERYIILRLNGGGMAEMELQVVNREGFDPKPYNRAYFDKVPEQFKNKANKVFFEGPDLTTLIAELEKPIHGTLTVADTGKPRAGVEVRLTRKEGMDLLRIPLTARTDATGHFTLHGARKAKSYMLEVADDAENGYVRRQIHVNDTVGYEPVTVDFRVLKGVIVTGHIRNRATGVDLVGSVRAAVLGGNPYVQQYKEMHHAAWAESIQDSVDGLFRIVTLPGPYS